MGLQLFSVRDAMELDPLDTLKKLKTMGYEDFETYGFKAAIIITLSWSINSKEIKSSKKSPTKIAGIMDMMIFKEK